MCDPCNKGTSCMASFRQPHQKLYSPLSPLVLQSSIYLQVLHLLMRLEESAEELGDTVIGSVGFLKERMACCKDRDSLNSVVKVILDWIDFPLTWLCHSSWESGCF